MLLTKSENGHFELDQSQLNPYSLAQFSWWHTGWIITELTRPHSRDVVLPAVFRGVDWDGVKRGMILHLQPTGVDRDPPSIRFQLLRVVDVHLRVLSFYPPMRLLQIRLETGEATVMRLEFHLEQRSAYGSTVRRPSDLGALASDEM